MRHPTPRLLEPSLLQPALVGALQRLNPKWMARNPVMFVVWVGSLFTTLLALAATFRLPGSEGIHLAFTWQISAWLWLTVLFANLATSLAEGRGKAQADALKRQRATLHARRLKDPANKLDIERIAASELRRGHLVIVAAGEVIPADGEVVEGIATVDESAVTGESAPVIRESGGDRSAVTGGTKVLSDWLVIRVTADPGTSFLDRMIGLIEAASRRKTPNEIALDILLAALTLIFLIVTATLHPFSADAAAAAGRGTAVALAVLVALLVCLIPTTIGGLLSAIGIAGMDRLLRKNVIATSGRAVEA
ncbi:MAG TPA: potassium-transporting ATPase subunit B, partial [Gemmatimonadales bacterium]|nr:potassium-transporting ATPase subunit B [Gemmatimonadales bacterium]